jgi:hypothetical protein
LTEAAAAGSGWANLFSIANSSRLVDLLCIGKTVPQWVKAGPPPRYRHEFNGFVSSMAIMLQEIRIFSIALRPLLTRLALPRVNLASSLTLKLLSAPSKLGYRKCNAETAEDLLGASMQQPLWMACVR